MHSTHNSPRKVSAKPSSRLTLPESVAYLLAAYIVGLSLFAAVTPSPLYATYGAVWHLSPLVLTLIYATYAFGVLVTLLFAGRVSDDIGRRPVLLAALTVLFLSTVLFAVAAAPAWLFVARALQGLATGAAISAASAALLDLHPRRDASSAGLANGVASSAGIGLGIFAAAALVQFGWAPRTLPYVQLAALIVVAIVGAYWMPNAVTNGRRPRVSFQRPRVPSAVRGPFLIASLATLSSWSLGGLLFSLGPTLGAQLFNSTNTVIAVTGIVALGAMATLSQLLFGRAVPWVAASLGSLALAAGVILMAVGVVVGTGSLYLAGSAIAGVGFGIGFLGGLRGLVTAIPAEHRASVMSAFYIVAYGSLSIPAILAGLVVADLGLHATFVAFGLIIAVVALVTAVAAWGTRPDAFNAATVRTAPARTF